MTIESSKTLGGIGALLLLIGTLPVIGTYSFGVLGIVGVILIFVALHQFASYYNDKGIFTGALYGLVTGIVGIVVTAAVALYLFFGTTIITGFLQKIYPTWNGSWSTISSLSGMTPVTTNITTSDIVPIVGAVFAVIVVVWVFAIITAFFVRRSLKIVAAKSSTGLFSTAGLLLLIGAVLIIALGFGLILVYIAEIILVIAFFTMKTQQPLPQETAATAPPTTAPTPV